jgi:TP901 family phage tail tape measure protein
MAGNFNIAYVFRAVDNFTNVVRKINNSVKAHEKNIVRAGEKLKRFGKSATAVGKTLRNKVTLPILAAGTGMVMAASKFEKGISNVYTLMSKKEIEKYGKRINEIAERTVKAGFSIEDMSKSLFDNISALGVSENSLKAYEAATRLSIAGNAPMSASVLGIAKVMNVYGRETTDVNRVINSLFTAQKVGTTTVEDLALNIGKVSGSAKMAGMSFEEMMATLSVLTNVLRNTEEASTAMAAILKAVTNPAKQSAKILNKLGITYGVSRVKAVGFHTVLGQVAKAMKTNEDLVARAIPEIRALRGVSSLTEESLSLMAKTVQQVDIDIEKGTGLTKAYNDQMKIFDRRFKMAIGSLIMASKKFGVVLIPYLIKFFNIMTKVLEKIEKLSPAAKKTILIFGGIAAALGPVIMALGFLAIALGAAGISFTAFWGAVFSPIGLITAAIIALSALGIYLYNKFKPFKNLVDNISKGLMSVFSFAGKIGGKIGSWAGGLFGGEKEIIKTPEIARKSKGEKSTFEGTLNIANAPKGSTLQTATTGAMNMNVGLNMEGAY